MNSRSPSGTFQTRRLVRGFSCRGSSMPNLLHCPTRAVSEHPFASGFNLTPAIRSSNQQSAPPERSCLLAVIDPAYLVACKCSIEHLPQNCPKVLWVWLSSRTVPARSAIARPGLSLPASSTRVPLVGPCRSIRQTLICLYGESSPEDGLFLEIA
jgi:hypothetical protein